MIRSIMVTLTVAWLAAATGLVSAMAADMPPDVLARRTTEKMLQVVREHRQELQRDPSMIYDLVKELVLPHFDFELMSRFVLAQHWRTATPAQRERFVDEFRELLVRTYGTSLAEYSGQSVEFEPMRSEASAGRVTVRSNIKQADGPPVALDYKLYKKRGEGWKVFDVIVEGVSLVQNYRSSFRSEIQRDGLDALIKQLSQRNAKSAHSS